MSIYKTAFTFLYLALPTIAHAQAFGVQGGAPVATYGGIQIGSNRYHYKITVPQPNNEFESYTAWAFPETGVCKVTGIGKDHTNDASGYETKAAFSKFKAALKEKYGQSLDYDFLHTGALWNKPSEWNWSIYKKERTLESFWSAGHNSTLPSNISGIDLDVAAVSSSAAYLSVSYEFSNMDRCLALKDQANAEGL